MYLSNKDMVADVNGDTLVITSYDMEKRTLEEAVKTYKESSNFHSTYFNESSGIINFKIEDVDRLALNAQTNLYNIIQINNIVRYFVNKNDILGKVYEAIETNINTEWTLVHPTYADEEKEIYKQVDELIRVFNEKIKLNKLITESIPMTYLEGNYVLYLRKDKENNNFQVDYYPLGICEVADYEVNGDPYILINIKELESRLRKIYRKNKKNKELFYKNMESEIEDTYPEEVYQAFIEKEQFARLNIENSGIMRVNNLKRKYGLSPIFKALKPSIRLENIELSDDKNTLVRGKKIIFQKLIKELVTQHDKLPNLTWMSAQAKAHVDLMTALNGKGTSVFTGTPWTESIEYIEPKLEQTNVQIKNQYRQEIMTSVGIAYLSADKGGYGSAQISITELLKQINRIGEQLENILFKWYKGVLRDNNIDEKYCPKIKVMDSEKLNIELSMQLSRMLNTELNASLETTFNVLGLDVKTEARRRQQESELGYDEIFKPRVTAFTNSGGDSDDVGRPKDSKDKDKQDYDTDYNKKNNR